MSERWFRLYEGVAHDPKLLRLPDRLFRVWVYFLCFASGNKGVLPSTEDIAASLRVSLSRVIKDIECLVSIGLLDRLETGIEPHNWNGRQYKSDVSTERVKRFREQHGNGSGNVSETPPETETETETETEKKRIRAVEVDRTRADMDFLDFWGVYPKRAGGNSRAEAQKKFRTAVLGGADPADIIAGAERYRDYCKLAGETGTSFVKMAATWLYQRCWEDEYAPPKETDDVWYPEGVV